MSLHRATDTINALRKVWVLTIRVDTKRVEARTWIGYASALGKKRKKKIREFRLNSNDVRSFVLA